MSARCPEIDDPPVLGHTEGPRERTRINDKQNLAHDNENCKPGKATAVATGPGKAYQADRKQLPYGMWTCQDGRQVLYNRDYEPIWSRHPGQPAVAANPNEWVREIDPAKTIYLFNDGCPPWLRQGIFWVGLRRDVATTTKMRCLSFLRRFLSERGVQA